MKAKLFFFPLLFLVFQAKSQEDLLNLVTESEADGKSKKVYATFKTTKIVSSQTIETVKKNNLDFRVTHRFGNVYNSSSNNALNDAAHTYFGLDNSTDIRISFDYGITDDITVGIGRNKFRETYDGTFKWRFMTQTSDNKIACICMFLRKHGLYIHDNS
jgi:hypothetical protein